MSGSFESVTTGIKRPRPLDDEIEKPLSLTQKMEKERKEGLSKKISSDNIGFKMLKLMGYSEGKGLGKHGDGISAPVEISLKTVIFLAISFL